MHPAIRKSVALPVVILVLALSACGGGSSSTGGAGAETDTTLAARGDGSATAPSTEAPSASADNRGTGYFSLVFEQSFQDCASCGIWFDSAELVIEHSRGTFKSGQVGSLLIKQSPYHQGTFYADTGSIPRVADIRTATLYMRLNPHEGISNNDFSSTLSVYGNVGGNFVYLREITAQFDIKGSGYSKSNPVVPIDFTDFAKRI